MSCFLTKEINLEKASNYILNEFNYKISNRVIYKIYTQIRNKIYNYLKFEYKSNPLAGENENKIFSVDESLKGHKNNNQIWLLGIINNQTKDFRVEETLDRNTEVLRKLNLEIL